MCGDKYILIFVKMKCSGLKDTLPGNVQRHHNDPFYLLVTLSVNSFHHLLNLFSLERQGGFERRLIRLWLQSWISERSSGIFPLGFNSMMKKMGIGLLA